MEPTRYRPGSLRELCAVALPLVFSSGSISLMHVIDRMFLTWDSTEALAAAMPAGMLHWTMMSIAIGTASYVNTFVAQYDGAGRADRVSASVWQGVYLSLIMGLPFLLVVPFSWDLFALFGHDPVVAEMEASYFAILCAGAVPTTMAAALACFYSGRGKTLPVMWINFFTAGVNVVLDYLLIFGPGPFPRWGIEGAAIATVIAQIAAVGCYGLLMCRRVERREYGLWRHWRFDSDLFRRLMHFGLPTGVQLMLDIAGFTLFLI
ncbi:MAG: MATE family efflux transporter, partial [Planctomycetaceae bacterium]